LRAQAREADDAARIGKQSQYAHAAHDRADALSPG
jgi:hypothetical protein